MTGPYNILQAQQNETMCAAAPSGLKQENDHSALQGHFEAHFQKPLTPDSTDGTTPSLLNGKEALTDHAPESTGLISATSKAPHHYPMRGQALLHQRASENKMRFGGDQRLRKKVSYCHLHLPKQGSNLTHYFHPIQKLRISVSQLLRSVRNLGLAEKQRTDTRRQNYWTICQ